LILTISISPLSTSFLQQPEPSSQAASLEISDDEEYLFLRTTQAKQAPVAVAESAANSYFPAQDTEQVLVRQRQELEAETLRAEQEQEERLREQLKEADRLREEQQARENIEREREERQIREDAEREQTERLKSEQEAKETAEREQAEQLKREQAQAQKKKAREERERDEREQAERMRQEQLKAQERAEQEAAATKQAAAAADPYMALFGEYSAEKKQVRPASILPSFSIDSISSSAPILNIFYSTYIMPHRLVSKPSSRLRPRPHSQVAFVRTARVCLCVYACVCVCVCLLFVFMCI
jgi:hypothetical protein